MLHYHEYENVNFPMQLYQSIRNDILSCSLYPVFTVFCTNNYMNIDGIPLQKQFLEM